MTQNRNIFLFFLYFFLSTVITWWFIAVCPLYISKQQMLLSCGIAGGKWMIQIVAGYLLLGDQKWEFLRRIGHTCFIGSVILLPYAVVGSCFLVSGAEAFVTFLALSVVTMIGVYRWNVRRMRLPLKWWFAWLGCLAIAISLQLTVVFHVV